MEMQPQQQQQQEAACIESITPVPAAIIPYYPKILQWSVGKIADSRRRRTGIDLRRNLLIANVIFKARNGILQLRAHQLLEDRTTTQFQSTALTSDTAEKPTSATDGCLTQPSAILSPGDIAASATSDVTAPTSDIAIVDLSEADILVPTSDIPSPTSDTPISSSDIPVPTSDTADATPSDIPEATSVASNSGIPLPTFNIQPPSPTAAGHILLPCAPKPPAAADLPEAAAAPRCRKRRSSCQLLTLPTASPAVSGTSAAASRPPLSAPPHSPPKRAMLLQGETPLAPEQQQLLVLQTSFLDLNVATPAATHTPPCLMCSS